MPGPRDYSPATRAALVELAGGTCYFPGCKERLIRFVEGEPYIGYEIAHIRDANPGNRFDDTMTDDERRAFKNLVLLCKPHHELIDKRHPDRYSVADIQTWKTTREANVRGALDELGTVDPDMLESALRNAASVTITNSTSVLGGQGGAAPGAGGGGGGVIGSGVGGPGGQGGDTFNLDGTSGAAPGTGGGGGGAVGRDAIGGEGGGGGECVQGIIDVDGATVLRVHVGKGGEGGEEGEEGYTGDDSWVEVVGPDGSAHEVVRAKGGVAGRSGVAVRDDQEGPALRITSAFLADAAQVRDGLMFVLGGGWDCVTVPELPGTLGGALVIVAEPVVDGSRPTELLFEVIDTDGQPRDSARLQVTIEAADRPLRLTRIFYFGGIEVSAAGIWRVTVRSGGVELASVPFRVAVSEDAPLKEL